MINFQESSPWYFRSTAASGARSDWVPSQHQGENRQTNKRTKKQKNKQTKEQSSKQHQGEINKWANISKTSGTDAVFVD